MSGIENGWVVSGRDSRYSGECEPDEEIIGTCSCCGDDIYYDEELETSGSTDEGQLLCWDCFERWRDERKA